MRRHRRGRAREMPLWVHKAGREARHGCVDVWHDDSCRPVPWATRRRGPDGRSVVSQCNLSGAVLCPLSARPLTTAPRRSPRHTHSLSRVVVAAAAADNNNNDNDNDDEDDEDAQQQCRPAHRGAHPPHCPAAPAVAVATIIIIAITNHNHNHNHINSNNNSNMLAPTKPSSPSTPPPCLRSRRLTRLHRTPARLHTCRAKWFHPDPQGLFETISL
jgi:hypothetical protein